MVIIKRVLIVMVVVVFLCPVLGMNKDQSGIERSDVERAQKVMGLKFSVSEIDSMLGDLRDNLAYYGKLREAGISNAIPPALLFNPIPAGVEFDREERGMKLAPLEDIEVPGNLEELSYCSVRELAGLIRSRKVTSTELTKMYINRLKKYGPRLECVITLTEKLALEQAGRADREIANGNYRGLLM
ncbi:MAG: amidase, partial [Candidatus Krumholzibacteria bacterium]|nr:amidase [Candidatus Krumholzibacteria bacterium]